MKLNSNTLEGTVLIWATCKALGHTPQIKDGHVEYLDSGGLIKRPCYTDLTEAAVLMYSEWIGVERPSKGQTPPVWRAITDSKLPAHPHQWSPVVSAYGRTLGVAVCRALVVSRIGDSVELPAELVDLCLVRG